MPTLDRRIVLPASIPRLADHSAYALPLIMAATSATHGGVVYGSLTYESPRDLDSAASPASGVGVRIASTGFLFDTVTDSDGTFIMTGVPPGEVTGRITGADGRPRPDLTIQLVPADSHERARRVRVPRHSARRQSSEDFLSGHARPNSRHPHRRRQPTQHDGFDFVVVW